MSSDTALRVDDVRKQFGAVTAVDDVSFALERGRTKSLIGPNGAGKTTLINCISGTLGVDTGDIRIGDRDITDLAPNRRAELGLGRTYQITNLFDDFTTLENVRLAAQVRLGNNLDMWSNYRRNEEALEQAHRILETVNLSEEADTKAGALSHGQKRQLEIGVSIATDPKILLLDEPAAGMGTENVSALVELLQSLQGEYSIILIEHNIDIVMEISDLVMVMNQGKLIADDTPDKIRSDERVRDAYLGTGDNDEW